MNLVFKNKKTLSKDFLYCIILILLAVLAMFPIWEIDGWPLSHDGVLLFDRVAAFYYEMQNGNFFPLWSPYGQNGYGTASPFLYHRAFNTVAALLSFPTGSVYWGVKVGILLFIFLGGLGMLKLICSLGLQLKYAFCAAILFMFANYTYTDWLIRASAAELTAMIFIPWLIYYCVQLIQNKNTGIQIGLVLSCMFYSHIVICYYAFFVVFTFYLVFLLENKRYLILHNYYPVFLMITILLLCCGIYALGILNYKKIYNFSSLVEGISNPVNNYPIFEKFLVNKSYTWGKTWRGLSMEIGRVFNLLSIIFTLLTIVFVFYKKISLTFIGKNIKIYYATLICIFIFVFLQTKASSFFYDYFPGANFIQFPWRLLSFSTVFSIMALCMSIYILSHNSKKEWVKKILMSSLYFSALYQIIFGLTIPINYEIMSRSDIDSYIKPESLIFAYQPNEYRPKSGLVPDRAKSLIEYGENCKVISEFPNFISKTVIPTSNIEIKVEGKCTIKYNQFINPFTKITFSKSGFIESTPDFTYSIVSNEYPQVIAIEKIGLIHSLINYYKTSKKGIYE